VNELKQTRTPEVIGAEIRMYVDAGRRVTTLCAIEIGRRLVEAKELLSHGEWLPWLKRETEFSERSAQNYMKIFNEYGAAQLGLFGPETNTQTFADLPISKALLLLSVPESEREDFAEEVNAEGISTRKLEEAIAARKAAEQRAADAERALHEAEEGQGLAIAELQEQLDAAKEAQQTAEREAKRAAEELAGSRMASVAALATAAKLREQVKELEDRPIATVKERDEEAIEEAARLAKAKAEAEAAEKLAAIQKKLDKAERERDKLKDAAGKAESGAADKIAAAERAAADARQELEAAQKQLKASTADAARFGVYFHNVQEDINRMMEIVREIREHDPETADKLCTGARFILQQTLDRIPAKKEG
jgi:DNA repair exonuclease SbcCD ATPase subunit